MAPDLWWLRVPAPDGPARCRSGRRADPAVGAGPSASAGQPCTWPSTASAPPTSPATPRRDPLLPVHRDPGTRWSGCRRAHPHLRPPQRLLRRRRWTPGTHHRRRAPDRPGCSAVPRRDHARGARVVLPAGVGQRVNDPVGARQGGREDTGHVGDGSVASAVRDPADGLDGHHGGHRRSRVRRRRARRLDTVAARAPRPAPDGRDPPPAHPDDPAPRSGWPCAGNAASPDEVGQVGLEPTTGGL